MTYRLLDSFSELFKGQPYFHRVSSNGDRVAMQLFEDLHEIGRSPVYRKRVDEGLTVLNQRNLRQGVKARRGDGTLGESLPHVKTKFDKGFHVARGHVATIEIGVEVKILGKSMIKQIDRVVNDLAKQVDEFRSHAGNPICVGLVGINHAQHYTGYEGKRSYPTDGRDDKHPIQEAATAEKHLRDRVASKFDEFLIFRFSATNVAPYPFRWHSDPTDDYAAALVRIGRQYVTRFG